MAHGISSRAWSVRVVLWLLVAWAPATIGGCATDGPDLPGGEGVHSEADVADGEGPGVDATAAPGTAAHGSNGPVSSASGGADVAGPSGPEGATEPGGSAPASATSGGSSGAEAGSGGSGSGSDGPPGGSEAGPSLPGSAVPGSSGSGGAPSVGSGGLPSPSGASVDCAPLGEGRNALCVQAADRCEGVFYDRSGCDVYCARAGLVCLSSYEDVETPGACAPDLARDELACRTTGHRSDYCVCGPADCVADCSGRACGTDGCGGVCAECPGGLPCLDGECASSERPWEDILERRVGFGRHATGGAGGEVCWVENLSNSGPGSFRACAESDAVRWIRFRVGGTIRLDSPVFLGSNTTVDGRGHRVRFEHQGLYIDGKENVIIHNVEIGNGGGSDSSDAIQIIRDARTIWVDHVTLESFPDGLLDITRGGTDITVSWSHFRNHDKVMLIGADKAHTGDTVIRVTLHHNWFQRTTQRHPRLRYGRVHVFNNYYERWGSYAIGSSQRGEVRSERNIYEAGDRREAFTTSFSADDAQGNIRSVTDLRLRNATLTQRNRDSVFFPDYPFVPEDANEALRQRIVQGAGRRDVPMP